MRHRPRSVTSGCQPAMLSTPPVVLSPRLLEPELQVPQCEVYAWSDLGVREGCFSEEVHAFPAVDVQMPRNNIQWNTMQINDLEKAPKLFCENIKIGYSNEYFVMALSSGSQATFYSLTPEHAKRLQMYLTHEIENFEKKHRPITAEWNPNVVSPVQKLNPPTEGS